MNGACIQFTESAQELVVEDKKDQKHYYFGIRCWHPKWLQILANAKFFTFLLCINGLVEGALVSGELLHGYLVHVPTSQKA